VVVVDVEDQEPVPAVLEIVTDAGHGDVEPPLEALACGRGGWGRSLREHADGPG
jgi:hypothetical protein